MKPGVSWLVRLHGGRAARVARAYAQALDPQAPEGRAVLVDLAGYCRVGRSSFVPGDPHQTAFNEGARDVFLHIAELAGLDAADFVHLFQEVSLD